jgi:hypothetical protein
MMEACERTGGEYEAVCRRARWVGERWVGPRWVVRCTRLNPAEYHALQRVAPRLDIRAAAFRWDPAGDCYR